MYDESLVMNAVLAHKICLVVLGLESMQAHLSECYTRSLTSHIQLS